MTAAFQLEFPSLPPVNTVPLKRCACCLTVKTVSEYSRDRSRSDGLTRHCRQCDSARHKQLRLRDGDLMRVRARQRYDADPERKRNAAAEFRRSDRGRALNLQAVRRYQQRNSEKATAHREVRKAIAAGILTKPERCEFAHEGGCSGRLELHHADYSKPLEVRALCARHHATQRLKPRVYDDPTPNLFTVKKETPAVHPDLARAMRRWPRLRYVVGTGRWALVSFCPPAERIELYETVDAALEARASFDARACPSECCRGAHRVLKLIDDAHG